MALIECKECGKHISDEATRCPNCGAITAKGEENNKIIGGMIWYVIAIVFGLVAIVIGAVAEEKMLAVLPLIGAVGFFIAGIVVFKMGR